MASTLPDLPPFDPELDPSTTPQRWSQYLARVETALEAWAINNDKQKCAVLLHRGGEKIHEIEQNLTYDRAEKDKKFENLTNALTAHFEPKRNVTFATYQFAKMQQ